MQVRQSELNRGKGKFCSTLCFHNHRKENPTVKEPNTTCHWCNVEFYRKPCHKKLSKSGLLFCSRICKETATKSGVEAIRPAHYGSVDHSCQDCGVSLVHKSKNCAMGKSRAKYCDKCRAHRNSFLKRASPDLTKGELFSNRKNWQSARSHIQQWARRIFLEANPAPSCQQCGYTHHVEVAHIKGVSEFLDQDLVSSINSLDNLMGLCPNHHWEYDNGGIR